MTKPVKRLRLVKRALTGSSIAGYAGLLDKSRNSNDALSLLLRIADALADDGEGSSPQQEDLNDTLRRLSEHYGNEKESAVRAKILSLYGDIGSLPGQDVQVHNIIHRYLVTVDVHSVQEKLSSSAIRAT